MLTDAGLPCDRVGEDHWMTVLAGEWKRTIPVSLKLDERTLEVSSLLCRDPDEGHEEVYRILLRYNQRRSPVHFALDDVGDVILLGRIPLAVLDAATLEEVLGAVLTAADDVFNRVLRAGFASYIATEQRWRARRGLPPNPVGEAP